FDVPESLPDRGGLHVVFVTAHDHYALRAFEAEAVDYILKPVDPDRFDKVLARVKRHIGQNGQANLTEKLRLLLHRYPKRILIPDGGRTIFIQASDIE